MRQAAAKQRIESAHPARNMRLQNQSQSNPGLGSTHYGSNSVSINPLFVQKESKSRTQAHFPLGFDRQSGGGSSRGNISLPFKTQPDGERSTGPSVRDDEGLRHYQALEMVMQKRQWAQEHAGVIAEAKGIANYRLENLRSLRARQNPLEGLRPLPSSFA